MRFFSLLFVAASAVLATAKQSIQPDLASIQTTPTTPAPAYRRSHHERITNAMRLRRGLPVLPPRHLAGTPTKRDGIHIAARASPSPSPSPNPGNPPAPPSVTGIIKLTNKKTGDFLGYLSKEYQIYGEFGVVADPSDALSVGIDRLRPGLNKAVDLIGLNGPDAPYNFVGAITGWNFDHDDLLPGQPAFKYIGGLSQTPAWSAPVQSNANAFAYATGIQKASESAIWQINTYTKEVTASWINSDGRPALTTEILYYPADNVLVLAGDVAAFESEYGLDERPSIPIKLTLEEA
jgi:hypothetical protein